MHTRPLAIAVDMRERLWLLRMTALILGIVSGIAFPIVLLNPQMSRLNVVNCFVLIVFSLLGFVLSYWGHLNIGGYCLAGALMYCISTLPPEQLLNGPLSTTYIIAIMVGGITGGARGIGILSTIAICILGLIGIISGNWSINAWTSLFTIIMTTIIVSIILHSLERALKDATRLVEAEHQLTRERHTRTLIRSLQHELKAHAQGVMGLVRLANQIATGAFKITESWEKVVLNGLEARAQRIEHMMQHLLVIAHGQVPTTREFELVSLRALIEDAQLESSVWEPGIHVTIDNRVGPDVIISCLPTYVQMALDTVIRNAVEAGIRRKQSQITIGVSSWVGNQEVVLCIEDDGPGFPGAVIEQVNRTDPHDQQMFIASAKGTGGLGLPLLRAIVQWHKGLVEIGNNQHDQNLGAWVKIRLPLPKDEPDVML